MPSVEDRLAAIVERPGNESCSECDRPDNRPTWASFFVCPVDNRRLGVLCCPKCHHLHQTVGEGEFQLKGIRDVDDFTEQDLEDLELSGNKLVNSAYEAAVTNEKDGRDNRQYGYEAHFFEKMMNLTYFNDEVYKQLIKESLRAQVERVRRSYERRSSNEEKKDSEDDRRSRSSRDDKYRDNDDRRSSRDGRSSSRRADNGDDLKKSSHHRSKSSNSLRSSKSSADDDRKSRRSRSSNKLYEDHNRSSSHRRSSGDHTSRRSSGDHTSRRSSGDHTSRRSSGDHTSRRERSSSKNRIDLNNNDDQQREYGKSSSSNSDKENIDDRNQSPRPDELRHSNRDLSPPVRTSSRDAEPQVRTSSRDSNNNYNYNSEDQVRASSRDQVRTSSRAPPEPTACWDISGLEEDEEDRRLKAEGRKGSRSDLRGSSSSDHGRNSRGDTDFRSSDNSMDNKSGHGLESRGSRGDLGAELRKEKMREQRRNGLKRANSPRRTSSANRLLPPRQNSKDKSSSGGMKRSTSRDDYSRPGSDLDLSSGGMRRPASRGDYSRSGSDRNLGQQRNETWDATDGKSRRGKRSGSKSSSSLSKRSQRTAASVEPEPATVEPKKADIRGEAYDFIMADREAVDALKKPADAKSEAKTEHEKTVEALKASAPPSPELLMHQKRIEALIRTAPNLKPEVVDALIATAPQHLHADLTAAIKMPKSDPPKPGSSADHKSTLEALKASAPKSGSLTIGALKLPGPSASSSDAPTTSSVLASLLNPESIGASKTPDSRLQQESVRGLAGSLGGNLATGMLRKHSSGDLVGLAQSGPSISKVASDCNLNQLMGGENRVASDFDRDVMSIVKQVGGIANALDRKKEEPPVPKIQPIQIAKPGGDQSTAEVPKKKSSAWDILKGRRADFIRIAQEELAEREAAGNQVAPDPTGDDEVTFGRRRIRKAGPGSRRTPARSHSGKSGRNAPAPPTAAESATATPKTQKKVGSAWAFLKSRRDDFIRIAMEEAAEREAAGNKVAPDPTGDDEVNFGRRRSSRLVRRGSVRNCVGQHNAPQTPQRKGLQRGASFSRRLSRSPARGLSNPEDSEQTAGRRGVRRGSSFSMRSQGRCTLLDAQSPLGPPQPSAGLGRPRRGTLQRGSSFSIRSATPSRGLL